MSSPFAITTTTNTVTLENNRQGQTSFTVSNTTNRTVHGHARVVAQQATAAGWFTLLDEAERGFAGSGSQQYTVQIAIPANAAPGDYTFQLHVADLANPDDNFSESPTVSFTIAAPATAQKKPFPWWIIAAIIGALILIGGGAYSLMRVSQKSPTGIANATVTPSASTTALPGTVTASATVGTATVTATGTAGTTTPAIPHYQRLTPMPIARFGFASVLGPDGRIYVMGGQNASGTVFASLEVYDPAKNSWTDLAPMPTPRFYLAAVLGPDGRIYAIGGASATNTGLATVEAYDIQTNTWTTLASMPSPRAYLAAVLGPNGRIYAIGGAVPNVVALPTVEVYDVSANSWSTVAPMPTPRYAVSAVVGSDGTIYAMGGIYQGVVATVEAYNPTSNTWTEKAPLLAPSFFVATTLGSDGHIYAIGGVSGGPNGSPARNLVEVYDPAANSWKTVAPLPIGGSAMSAVLGPDGRIYVIGGSGVNGNPAALQTIQIYDPTTDSWTD